MSFLQTEMCYLTFYNNIIIVIIIQCQTYVYLSYMLTTIIIYLIKLYTVLNFNNSSLKQYAIWLIINK